MVTHPSHTGVDGPKILHWPGSGVRRPKIVHLSGTAVSRPQNLPSQELGSRHQTALLTSGMVSADQKYHTVRNSVNRPKIPHRQEIGQ